MITRSFSLMGTNITLMTERYHTDDSVFACTENMLRRYEKIFSANREDSVLGALNRSAGVRPVKVDADLFELIQIGKRESLNSEHRLNIAIGPLTDLWRIGFPDARLPSPAEIEACLPLLDPNDIELDEGNCEVFLQKKGMQIDLGALAKGYFADKIREYWKEQGVQNGLIDLGRNIHTIGGSKNSDYAFWTIGIADPFRKGGLKTAVRIRNKSIVTSGIYERFLELDGVHYPHILDARNGRPIDTELASVSVIADSSLQAEILSTAMIFLEVEEALYEARRRDGVDVILIDRTGELFTSITD